MLKQVDRASRPDTLTDQRWLVFYHLLELILQMDIQNRIRDILSDTIQQDFMGQSGKVGEEELLHKLKQQGLVDDILHQLQFRGQQGGTTPATHFLDRDDKVTQLPTKKGLVKVEFSLFRCMKLNIRSKTSITVLFFPNAIDYIRVYHSKVLF